jgi:hypothetical protein
MLTGRRTPWHKRLLDSTSISRSKLAVQQPDATPRFLLAQTRTGAQHGDNNLKAAEPVAARSIGDMCILHAAHRATLLVNPKGDKPYFTATWQEIQPLSNP